MQLKLSSPYIWIASEPVDFRRSIDGLCGMMGDQFRSQLREAIFVFYNRHRDKLKILAWHGNGFVLLYKRLEEGKFTIIPRGPGPIVLDERQLSWLLAGLDWIKMSAWSDLEYDDFS